MIVIRVGLEKSVLFDILVRNTRLATVHDLMNYE